MPPAPVASEPTPSAPLPVATTPKDTVTQPAVEPALPASEAASQPETALLPEPEPQPQPAPEPVEVKDNVVEIKLVTQKTGASTMLSDKTFKDLGLREELIAATGPYYVPTILLPCGIIL